MSSKDNFNSLNKFKSTKDLRKLKVEHLKSILRNFGEPTSGKKEDLVLRCFILVERTKAGSSTDTADNDPVPSTSSVDLTYEVIIREATNCVWNKDLRELPAFTFVQLYDYLVKKTSKYSNLDVSSSAGYKKLKAFNFFKEGHIKDLQLCEKDSLVYVKAEVLASMKSEKYKSVLVFNRTNNNIVRAACKCPAGRGENGMGRCNHIGGIIFAIEDFNRCGLREKDQPVSCTSRLCGWNVPRNMKVEPRPIDKIIFQKIRYGKATMSNAKITSYDPRAPADRVLDSKSLATMSEKLSCCLKSSSFFLFHNVKPSDSLNIQIDSICESIPDGIIDVDELPHTEVCQLQDVPFNDDYNINSKAFKEIIDCYVKGQKITDKEVKDIERDTRGQSENDAWKKLKETVLTASNFKKAVVRRKAPDTLLKDIMYIKNCNKPKVIPSLDYGIQHEEDAVQCYVALHHAAGNIKLKVTEVGTNISKETPGIGASLDRLVYDPSSTDGTEGGLEVKCPYSKRGMSVTEACSDSKFYLTLLDGHPVLKRGHAYFYQVQGQMYVCNLPWVDILVWFGNDVVAVQRVKFDRKWWLKKAMPALMFFYKRAFLPEVFTRRVKRGVPLYRHGGWISYGQSKKIRSN